MEEALGDNTMGSKCIAIRNKEKGTRIPVILTAYDGEDHEVFHESGYRSRGVFITLMDAGYQETVTNVHDIQHGMVSDRTKTALDKVIKGWKTYGDLGINWTEIEDGGQYTTSELLRLNQVER